MELSPCQECVKTAVRPLPITSCVTLPLSVTSVAPQGVFEDDDAIHLVMELCEGGGILDRMKQGNLTEARIAAIIRSVLRFIAQCHAKGIIYRCGAGATACQGQRANGGSPWPARAGALS